MGLPKVYETIAQLGARSTTGDTEGEIEQTGRVPPDPPVLPTGEVRQRPPAYSAVKIGGERAYKRARRGEQLEMPERIVTVTRFEQLWREQSRGRIRSARGLRDRVRLGNVRALADRRPRRRLLPELRRTAIGPFAVGDAVAPPARGRAGEPRRRAGLDRARPGARAGAVRRTGFGAAARSRGHRHWRESRGSRWRASGRGADHLGLRREGHPPARRRARRPAHRGRRNLRRGPPGPSRGDRRVRQRAHLRPAPGLRRGAPAHAEAAHHARAQGRADRLARRGGDGRDPVRRGLRRAQRGRVHRAGAGGRARREPRLDRRELPLRAPRAGRPRDARRRRALRDGRAPAARGRR